MKEETKKKIEQLKYDMKGLSKQLGETDQKIKGMKTEVRPANSVLYYFDKENRKKILGDGKIESAEEAFRLI